MKEEGRFFALMSLILRGYFVSTEMLISKNILPLFPSITMRDSLNTTFKKMRSRVPGHGPGYPNTITYAYHIDYSKWNNHQRNQSTKPIFESIDQSLGFSAVISRTHDVFEASLIYRADSPHLFYIDDNLDGQNKTEVEVFCPIQI